MTLMRLRATWTGFSGAPGVNTFFFNYAGTDAALHAQTCADALGTFYSGFKMWLPNSVRIAVDAQADIIDPVDGTVQDIVGLTPPGPAAGGSTGGYSAPSGAVIHWLTNDVVNGRRVRGRTFIVPLANQGYDAGGTLEPTVHGQIINAATALRADETIQLSVWSRPVAPDPMLGKIGSQHRAASSSVPDKAAVLRSRRD